MYTIEEYNDFYNEFEETRYIIVDRDGYDFFGEHYDIEEALAICKGMNKYKRC